MASSNLAGTLRRSLLIKVISKPAPSREDVASVIELTASKVVEALQAQSMTFYLVEGNEISFKQVYYSPTLWAGDPAKEKKFQDTAAKLLSLKIPTGKGIVGKVIESGEPIFFRNSASQVPFMSSMAQTTGFEVRSMLTVPLKTTITLGAIQVLNKELSAGTDGEFTDKDLTLLKEVAEYSSTLIHRMVDPKFVPNAEDTARFVSKLTDLPLVTKLEEIEIDDKLIEVVGDAVIRREGIFPHKRMSPSSVAVLMTNPLDYAKRESFTQTTEMSIEEVSVISATLFDTLLKRFFKDSKAGPAAPTEIDLGSVSEVIANAYSEDGTAKEISAKDLESEESAPIVQLANRIIEDAYISGASDIHIEPQEKELIVRYRVDGLLAEKLRLPKQVTGGLVARLKIMCNLDISERRLPQDGRIVFKQFTKKNMDLDLRVATGPMKDGEKVVMRILDKQKSTLPLPALGFSEENLQKYRDCIRQPYGMILHCGPTGSGKSMTLYSALNEINTPDIVIRTAEDPIEYTLPGLNQMQMHRQIGLTFATALRAFLRQDPDIILVGEIRDKETAGIAVEAALTGHLLISTLHTNDAPGTVARLTEMGVESFMVSSSLLCVCAQRLMRRVCKQCKQPYEPEGAQKVIMEKAIGWTGGQIFRANPKGCPKCGGSGYKGRVGIHELMVSNEELIDGINKEMEAAELKKIAQRGGMKTLHQDSILKVKEGLTTIEEAIANVPPDM